MELQNGELTITLADKDPPDNKITLDIIECRVAAEEAERRHTNAGQVATVPMLKELAEFYSGQGIEGCTTAAAWQIYHAVNREFEALKKNIGR